MQFSFLSQKLTFDYDCLQVVCGVYCKVLYVMYNNKIVVFHFFIVVIGRQWRDTSMNELQGSSAILAVPVV